MDGVGVFGLLVDATSQATTRPLPWGWYALLAAFDILLAAIYVRRRSHRRRRAARMHVVAPLVNTERAVSPSVELTGVVLRSGWWVPSSRAAALPPHPATYAWPVHREYMVSRTT